MTIQNKMEDLCRPVIIYICNLWIFKNKGYEPKEEDIVNEINIMLSKIKEKCSSDPLLNKEFLTIEKSLIFFIDYVIKEGNFTFSKSWKNLSKKYGELSGDDKFFDILQSILLDPTAEERIEVLYLLMGLGFDGSYKGNPSNIENLMRTCVSKMQSHININKDLLTPCKPVITAHKKKYSKPKILIISYTTAAVILILSLVYNYNVFSSKISPVSNIIEHAISNATQNFEVYTFDNQLQEEGME